MGVKSQTAETLKLLAKKVSRYVYTSEIQGSLFLPKQIKIWKHLKGTRLRLRILEDAFIGPRYPWSDLCVGFRPENPFLLKDPRFHQWRVCSPWRYLRFGTFGSIF